MKNKSKLAFGLNTKKKTSNPKSSSTFANTPQQGNVFGDDSDDESGNESENVSDNHLSSQDGRRQRVNRQIAKEQAALRQRAQAVLEANQNTNSRSAVGKSLDTSVYDYDEVYDSFHSKHDKKEDTNDPKTSRYIGDLLETAKKRQREREAVLERKIAKEQKIEEEQEDFVGKEKFITKAYRKKLEERKQWEAEEEKQQIEDAKTDITKKTGGAGETMASFYGNFSHNVAVGGKKPTISPHKEDKEETLPAEKDTDTNDLEYESKNTKETSKELGFLSGFETSKSETMDAALSVKGSEVVITSQNKLSDKELRAQKVAAARERYLIRCGEKRRQAQE